MATAHASSNLSDKLPPQNLDAEKSILGCMLLVNEDIDDVADTIQPHHFYSDAHQRIARAIYGLYESTSGGVDPVTLAEELDRQNDLDEIGGVGYVHEILETVPHAAHAKHYARIVREKSVLRSLRDACTSILAEVFDESDETQKILNSAEQRIFKILELKGNAENLEIRSILMDTFDAIHHRWMNEGKLNGLATGFSDLDSKTNGLHPSDLVILAARPSMGKTAFICNLALSIAKESRLEHESQGGSDAVLPGQGVLIFSLEQSKLELSERFLCIFGKLDGHRLKQGNLEPDEREQVQVSASGLSELPIFIDDQAGRSMAEISAIARRMKRRNDISLIVIDYLQLIEPEDPKSPREQQVAQITRRLKFLAKEIGVPVVALAQLNRGVELREDKRPRLADLRESGAIEQDADLVMFLHRWDAYDPKDRPNEAVIIVAKHRNGPTGEVPLTWIRESMQFVDHSNRAEPEGGYFPQNSDDGFA